MSGLTPKYAGLMDRIGYDFNDVALLDQALTHPSLSKGRTKKHRETVKDYDRLEFLGDRVLGLTVAEYLYGNFDAAESGVLSRRYNSLVRSETLAMIAGKIDLGPYIQMSDDLAANGGRNNQSILEDCMESLIAALYLDGGFDVARAFILKLWGDSLTALDGASRDAKSALQEYAARQGLPVPVYTTTNRDGPDHAPRFTVEVKLGDGAIASGHAPSKRAAEQIAAGILLKEHDHDD